MQLILIEDLAVASTHLNLKYLAFTIIKSIFLSLTNDFFYGTSFPNSELKIIKNNLHSRYGTDQDREKWLYMKCIVYIISHYGNW